MEENIRVIEINGVKMEIDLRLAKRVDTFKVGDTVKLLKKRYSDWQMLPAVIINFVEFKNLPSIELLYMDDSGEVYFQAINSETKEVELAPASTHEFKYSRGVIEERMNRNINAKQKELQDAQNKLEAFNMFFGKIFTGENKV